MPRTKVSKNSKRNRETAKQEEKIRDFDASVDKFMTMLDQMGQSRIDEIDAEVKMLLQRTSNVILQMKFGEFMAMGLTRLGNTPEEILCPESEVQSVCSTIASTTMLLSTKTMNPTDEGYLTADGSERGSAVSVSASTLTVPMIAAAGTRTSARLQQPPQLTQQQQRGRTPGPFSSARARRPRRSRSACGVDVIASLAPLKSIASATPAEHMSRNKLRTPMCGRSKALSADRSSQLAAIQQQSNSPPTALLRWPRPGELVVSMCGSPVVAQVMPDKFANVNIPVKSGVLSLRPKKLGELKPEILEGIDSETLGQIRTLHENLNIIMNMAEKISL